MNLFTFNLMNKKWKWVRKTLINVGIIILGIVVGINLIAVVSDTLDIR